jgi:hypothetical protein
MVQGSGVVKYWELEYDSIGNHFTTRHHSWEFGEEAFHNAVKNGANSATLYAVSKGRRIATWVHKEQ